MHDSNAYMSLQRLPPAAHSGDHPTHHNQHPHYVRTANKDVEMDDELGSPSSQMSDIRAASPISVLLRASDTIAARETDATP
jgi:hypothetical protein